MRGKDALERYTDTYNFGKVKGDSTNTNIVTFDSTAQQMFNETRKDFEGVEKWLKNLTI